MLFIRMKIQDLTETQECEEEGLLHKYTNPHVDCGYASDTQYAIRTTQLQYLSLVDKLPSELLKS